MNKVSSPGWILAPVSLISTSPYSNTGLIIAPNDKGIKIIVGAEMTDTKSSFGVIGILVVSCDIVPAVSIISGNCTIFSIFGLPVISSSFWVSFLLLNMMHAAIEN